MKTKSSLNGSFEFFGTKAMQALSVSKSNAKDKDKRRQFIIKAKQTKNKMQANSKWIRRKDNGFDFWPQDWEKHVFYKTKSRAIAKRNKIQILSLSLSISRLHPFFTKILSFVVEKRVRAFQTNGLLFDNRWKFQFSQLKILENFPSSAFFLAVFSPFDPPFLPLLPFKSLFFSFFGHACDFPKFSYFISFLTRLCILLAFLVYTRKWRSKSSSIKINWNYL